MASGEARLPGLQMDTFLLCPHMAESEHSALLYNKLNSLLGSTTKNKVSGGDVILAELFKILKDDVVKVLHSGKQQWPWDWKRSVFITIPKKGNAKECSNCCTIAFISHVSKVVFKILQARLQ